MSQFLIKTSQSAQDLQRPDGKPIRVLYVIWSLGLGGAEQLVIQLAAGLDRSCFLPMIACLNDAGPFAHKARAADVDVVALGKSGRYDVSVLWKLIALMRRFRPDIVHTYLWGGNLWGRLAAFANGVDVIITSEVNLDTWKRHYHFLIDRILARWTTRLIAVSHNVRQFYEDRGVGHSRWQVIYNGVDGAQVKPRGRTQIYKSLKISDEEPVVGFVGRLVPAKGPQLFVEAVARALMDFPSLRALIIGEGFLRPQIEEQVRRLGLEERVIFTGMQEDVSYLLAGMDVLIVSSEREGFSMAMLEAMASGVPVVATCVGGTPELITTGTTGILVPAADAEALSGRLVELLRNKDKADSLSRAARHRALKEFPLKRTLRAHEDLYFHLIEKKRNSSSSTEEPKP